MNDTPPTFGTMIAKARKARRLTQEQLLEQHARRFKSFALDRKTLSDLEHDRADPRNVVDIVKALADVLGLDEAQLFEAANDFPRASRLRREVEERMQFEQVLFRVRYGRE